MLEDQQGNEELGYPSEQTQQNALFVVASVYEVDDGWRQEKYCGHTDCNRLPDGEVHGLSLAESAGKSCSTFELEVRYEAPNSNQRRLLAHLCPFHLHQNRRADRGGVDACCEQTR